MNTSLNLDSIKSLRRCAFPWLICSDDMSVRKTSLNLPQGTPPRPETMGPVRSVQLSNKEAIQVLAKQWPTSRCHRSVMQNCAVVVLVHMSSIAPADSMVTGRQKTSVDIEACGIEFCSRAGCHLTPWQV